MRKKISCFLICTILLNSIAFCQQNKFGRVDKELEALNKERLFTGAILVASSGRVIYEKNIGYADIAHKVAIDKNTKFEIASITKTFTAILILQLVQKGLINLNSSISDYFPEFAEMNCGVITVHHLLSHTSGIQDFVGLNCDFSSWKEKDFLNGLKTTPINFKAGEKFEYASSSYILLRFIIEKVTGKSYEANLTEEILKVSGMTNTGIVHNQQILNNGAAGYIVVDNTYKNALPVANHEIFIGASSIYSTCGDLLKFDHALNTDKLLKQKEREQMYTIVKNPYGYGWFISNDPAKGKIVSHGGDIFGYTSLFERRLKDKTTIIILSNLQGVDREKIVNLLNKHIN